MKKRMIIMISALLVVFGGIVLFHLVKDFFIKRYFASFEAPPVSISSVTAQLKNWEPHINTVGNFVAMDGVDVNSQATGNVVKIHFESGQYVDANAPLVNLDDSIEQANLKSAQADRALKQISYQRQTDLQKRGATSGSNVDEAKANLQQAEASVEKIEAEIRQKHISAPFSGRLGIRQVNLGEYVTPGKTAVVTLQSLDPLFLEFNLPEHLFKSIHINQGIIFQVDAFPKIAFRGRISAINSKVDPKSHNILVQATVPNCRASILKKTQADKILESNTQTTKTTQTTTTQTSQAPQTGQANQTQASQKGPNDNTFKVITCNSADNHPNKEHNYLFLPGMFAAIAIEQPPVPNVVILPSTAISYSLYGDTVFLIEKAKNPKKDKDGREIYQVKRVFIVKGEQEGNKTVILKGIKAGDKVVSSGEVKLQNGANVVINNDIMLEENSNFEKLGE
jgi:membrane fusion protein (multidrug efflux system)